MVTLPAKFKRMGMQGSKKEEFPRKIEGFMPPAGNVILETRNTPDQGCRMDSDAGVQREQLLRRAVLAGDEGAWQAWYDENFDTLYASFCGAAAGNTTRPRRSPKRHG